MKGVLTRANPSRGGDAKPGVSHREMARLPAATSNPRARQRLARTPRGRPQPISPGASPSHVPSVRPRLPPAAHARGARDGAGRRRHHGGLRRRLHRHVGQRGHHVRDRHADDRQLHRGARPSGRAPPTCAPATRPASAPSTSRTPARCPASSPSSAAPSPTATRTYPLSTKLNLVVKDCGVFALHRPIVRPRRHRRRTAATRSPTMNGARRRSAPTPPASSTATSSASPSTPPPTTTTRASTSVVPFSWAAA